MSQRFTDAELAAEYWRAESDASVIAEYNGPGNYWRTPSEPDANRDIGWEEHDERRETLERFATLPHAHDPEPRTVYAYDQTGRCIGSFADPRPEEEPFRDWSINTGKDD